MLCGGPHDPVFCSVHGVSCCQLCSCLPDNKRDTTWHLHHPLTTNTTTWGLEMRRCLKPQVWFFFCFLIVLRIIYPQAIYVYANANNRHKRHQTCHFGPRYVFFLNSCFSYTLTIIFQLISPFANQRRSQGGDNDNNGLKRRVWHVVWALGVFLFYFSVFQPLTHLFRPSSCFFWPSATYSDHQPPVSTLSTRLDPSHVSRPSTTCVSTPATCLNPQPHVSTTHPHILALLTPQQHVSALNHKFRPPAACFDPPVACFGPQ